MIELINDLRKSPTVNYAISAVFMLACLVLAPTWAKLFFLALAFKELASLQG